MNSATSSGRSSLLLVVIPHGGRSALLGRSVASAHPHPVLVVDDSGTLGGEVLHTSGRVGFARACNLGLATAQARGFAWVLLLNDDAWPLDDCVATLLAAIRPDIRLLGPVIVGPGGVESAGIRYSERTARVVQRTRVPAGPTDVAALSGACLLARSDLRFSEDFPHAFEDVELGVRVRRAGGRVVLVPSARCWHQGGATVPRRSREATRDALIGHLRLVGDRPAQRMAALVYAGLQVLREGGPADRLAGLREAWRRA